MEHQVQEFYHRHKADADPEIQNSAKVSNQALSSHNGFVCECRD